MNIGQHINLARNKQNLSIRQLSEKSYISQSTIAGWIYRGSQPTVDLLIRVADVLDISLDELCGRKFPKNEEVTMAISNIPTEERLSKEFDQIMQTIIGDKDRIIKTMLDRCMSAEIYIPLEPFAAPHYQITFTHAADITND